jgi:hypothetical protein
LARLSKISYITNEQFQILFILQEALVIRKIVISGFPSG